MSSVPGDANVDVGMTWRVTDDGRGAATYGAAHRTPGCGRCSYFDGLPRERR